MQWFPPGADIEVDGSFVGNTPSDVQVTEGDHTVVVNPVPAAASTSEPN